MLKIQFERALTSQRGEISPMTLARQMETFKYNPGKIFFLKFNTPVSKGILEEYSEAYAKVQNQNLSNAPPTAKMSRINPIGIIEPRMSRPNFSLKFNNELLLSCR